MAAVVYNRGSGASPREVSDFLSERDVEKARVTGLAFRLAYTVSGGVTRILEGTRLEKLGGRLTLHMSD